MKKAVKNFWIGISNTQTADVKRADFWWNVLATGLTFAVLYGVELAYYALLFQGNFNQGIDGGDPRGIFPMLWGILIGLITLLYLLAWLNFTYRRLNDAGFSGRLLYLWLLPVAVYSVLEVFHLYKFMGIPVALAGLCGLLLFILCQFPSKK